MMDKKILASMLIIAVASTLLGAGTIAYFSDTETSKGNTFTVDCGPDLQIQDGNEDWRDGVAATWTMGDMKPGDTVFGLVQLRNVGSHADHLEITCDYTVIEELPQTEADTDPHTDEHPDDMAKQMIITKCEYYSDGWTIHLLNGTSTGPETPPTPSGYTAGDWNITDVDTDGKITLYDLKNAPVDNLPLPDGWTTTFDMILKFSEYAGNDFQGDTLNVTMIFTLNQHPSQ
jgi:predicted ribosomally synthesized peptide with SipW-like signal peptide